MHRRSDSRLVAFAAVCSLVGALTACGGSGGGGGGSTPVSPMPGPTTVVVEIRDFEFLPKSITVQPGDTVIWRLTTSTMNHTVTAIGGAFDSGFTFTAPGATFTRTFTDADAGKTFEYWCQTHHATNGMQGSVRVGNSAPEPTPGY